MNLKVITPEEFIQSLPKELDQDKIPEPEQIILKGNIYWSGHLHYEDLENLVKSLQQVFNFTIPSEQTNQDLSEMQWEDYLRTGTIGDDMFKVEGEWQTCIEDEEHSLKMSGMHSFPDIDFYWSIKDPDVIQKLYKASQLYEEIARNKGSRFTFINRKIGDWYLGAKWYANGQIENFLSNEKGTIFYWQEGNRDEYRYESKIPSSEWIFHNPTTKKEHQEILDKLWDAYDAIKDKVLFYDLEIHHSRHVLSKEKDRHFHVKVKFEFSDLDFKPYIPYKSAIDLAETYQSNLKGLDQGRVVSYPNPVDDIKRVLEKMGIL